MIVYHRTHHSASILRDGFRDGYRLRLTEDGEPLDLHGIFVSAQWPLDENEGADGDVVLELDIPETLFAEHEWLEEGKTYREAMIPAADLNRYPARVLSADEEDELTMKRWNSFRPRAGHSERYPPAPE